MSKLENLKAELKLLNAEYAKIKTLPPAERGRPVLASALSVI